MNTCLVCGYDKLRLPPDDGVICPSCGTQFGYTDAGVSHRELLRLWLERGNLWHSNVTPPPPGWNPYVQLKNLSHVVEATTEAITEGSPIGVVEIGQSVVKPVGSYTEIQGRHWVIGKHVEGVRPITA